jgi:hypothetical protein
MRLGGCAAAVAARAARGISDSNQGNAKVVPKPRNTVRRDGRHDSFMVFLRWFDA